MRVFLAVPVPEGVRHALVAALEAAVSNLPGAAVRPPNWHVTVRFLGEVEPHRYEVLASRLADTDLGEAFEVRWSGLGAFPRPTRANVLWLGPDRGEEPLTALAAAVLGALERAGFPPEERPFHPHLTLSRIRPAADVSALVATVAPLGVTMAVDRVTAYQSRLRRGGADYKVLDEFMLS